MRWTGHLAKDKVDPRYDLHSRITEVLTMSKQRLRSMFLSSTV